MQQEVGSYQDSAFHISNAGDWQRDCDRWKRGKEQILPILCVPVCIKWNWSVECVGILHT